MALIDTRKVGTYLSTRGELVSKLREHLMEELDAANSYDELIRCCRMLTTSEVDANGNPREVPPDRFSKDDSDKLAQLFEEIKRDEIEHSGIILNLMEDLDPALDAAMRKGMGA
jgi:hypothetical protein